MKTTFCSIATIITCLFLSACSSDDNDISLDDIITTPNSSASDKVTSIERSGYFDKAFNWSFEYNGKSLKKATRTVKQGDASQEIGETTSYNISYGTTEVKVKSTGMPMTLNVKSDGLLETLKCGNATYTYYYSDNKLVAWKSDFTFNGPTVEVVKGARGEISWEEGNIKEIRYTPSTDAEHKFYTYKLEYDQNLINSNGILPELISEAIGIDGIDFIYYSGLLGNGTTNITKSINVSHSIDKSEYETYRFNYRYANGNVASCNYMSETLDNGIPAVNVHVSYKY